MDFYLTLTLVPIIWTNIWHGILLCQPTPDHKPHTMSEHAVMKPQLLLVHRMSHTILSVVMLLFVFNWLIPKGYYIAAVMAFSAAIFDVIEVYALNSRTAKSASGMNLHEKTAWLMALSYMLYSGVISHIAGLSPWVYGSVFLLCAILFARVRKGKNKEFWIMQMVFFTIISLLGVGAYLTLLI